MAQRAALTPKGPLGPTGVGQWRGGGGPPPPRVGKERSFHLGTGSVETYVWRGSSAHLLLFISSLFPPNNEPEVFVLVFFVVFVFKFCAGVVARSREGRSEVSGGHGFSGPSHFVRPLQSFVVGRHCQ